MARHPVIEERLHRWASAVTVGDGSGYPAVNVLHQNWSPPSPGLTPTLKAAPRSVEVRHTHQAVARLSCKQRNAVVMHYVIKPPIEEQCWRLECARSTLFERIEAAHEALARDLLGHLCKLD